MSTLPTRPHLKERHQVESFLLSSRKLVQMPELRLDASYFNPAVMYATESLRQSGMRVEPLGQISTRIFIPPRFKRIYVDGSDVGIPFLQGSHVVHFQPADLKYLSKAAHHKLERWIVDAGWLLVTCSGTIGRVAICPPEWHGWAASQHILRIVPDEKQCPSGYLCSFLSSAFGQAQLTANIYGAVVDELTEEQAAGILVPLPITKEDNQIVSSIDREVKKAIKLRSEAIALIESADRNLSGRLE